MFKKLSILVFVVCSVSTSIYCMVGHSLQIYTNAHLSISELLKKITEKTADEQTFTIKILIIKHEKKQVPGFGKYKGWEFIETDYSKGKLVEEEFKISLKSLDPL